ncbi:tyrosine-type recombinase/integrase [Cryptosporangium minutisporangium]|uniref:Core-binding (CB) domain-containing protein n=1 Tax=Cryptosporangium minutisporangium TaxID=113569 RepID=A0ABP6TBF7_9ACTN
MTTTASAPDAGLFDLAVAAYLGQYRGTSRLHNESDLRVYLRWCTDERLDPLTVTRADVERYVRWLQDVRCYQPSTVSRRLSVVVGFYRVCVIDQVLTQSPADYVRRPLVSPESPTLGLGHLQFEALLTTARLSANLNDFALIAMLGLLGLRIFEATGATIADLGEEHGHRVLRVRGKGGKVVLVPLPPAVGRALDRAVDERTGGPILRNTAALGWTDTPRPASSRIWPGPPGSGCLGCTRTCSDTHSSRRCSTPASASATPRSPLGALTHGRRCVTTGHARTSTATPTVSSPPTWPPGRNDNTRPCR